MTARQFFPGIITFLACAFLACSEEKRPDQTHFTKADSLTDTYLELKDTMLESWNSMINDDNQKLKAMDNLLHELMVSNPSKREELQGYQERLDQLVHSRYTQKTMENEHVIEEYDFASNSLVTELIALAESQPQFGYNTTLQKLVETIRTAEQRVENYRAEYDEVAMKYNEFIEHNKQFLHEIEEDTMSKKALFQTVAEE
ncbi:MAG TPA: LemA family protein [Chryseosolibacter sp.]